VSPPLVWSLLAAVVCFAFAAETALGFGAMVLSLALGAQLVPLDALLPMVLPLNVALSGYLVSRTWRDIDRRFLFRRLFTAVLAGVPLGIVAFAQLPRPMLVRAFGGFVVALAVIELVRVWRRADAQSLPRPLRIVLLVLGGAIHGAFATGGPLIVYVASRELPDKGAFRATLSALWAVAGVAVAASLAVSGKVTRVSLSGSALLVVPCVLGLIIGEAVHRRVDGARLRIAVFVMLLVAGVLLVRGG
jgi:uncharacterized membrane protein YfcA